LWGLVAYAVERRTAEMGVRLALGATPGSLVRLAMRPAGVAIVFGVGIGCVLGATVATVVQAASVGLAPVDLVAVVPVAVIFTVVAMTSAWWPARRAGMADPAASLRRE
jgi:ABC-type antimicrobial peptide transport system permease subunit